MIFVSCNVFFYCNTYHIAEQSKFTRSHLWGLKLNESANWEWINKKQNYEREKDPCVHDTTLSNCLNTPNYEWIPELQIMCMLTSPYLITIVVKSSFILGMEFRLGVLLGYWYYQHFEHLLTIIFLDTYVMESVYLSVKLKKSACSGTSTVVHIPVSNNHSLSFLFPRILNIYTQNSYIEANDIFSSESAYHIHS